MKRLLDSGLAILGLVCLWALVGCQRPGDVAEVDAAKTQVRQQPNSPGAWVALGKAYLQASRYNDAFIAYRGALRIDDKSFEALCGVGEASLRLGDAQGALQWAARALDRRPDDPAALGLRGRARLAMGQTEGALVDLERAASLDSSLLENRLALVNVYRARNQPDRALNQAAKIAAQFPEEARAHHLYAMLLDAAERLPEAEQEYRRALLLDNSLTAAKFALALNLVHQNRRLDEARRLAAEVDAAQPGEGTAAGLAGWALFLSGKQEQGLRELTLVYKKYPRNVQVVVWIKAAALRSGNTELAEAAGKTLQALTAVPPS